MALEEPTTRGCLIMKVSFQRPKRTDYNRGWDDFLSGKMPMATPTHAYSDGYNRAREEALRYNDSMNAHREMVGKPKTEVQYPTASRPKRAMDTEESQYLSYMNSYAKYKARKQARAQAQFDRD